MIFLIHYDQRAGKIVSMQRFDEPEREDAERARLELEISLHRQQRDEEEVVILEAESEEAIWKTHGRYFRTVEQLIAASNVAR